MAKATKTSGYLVKIEAFVPAELTDSEKLSVLQDAMRKCHQIIDAPVKVSITPTRR